MEQKDKGKILQIKKLYKDAIIPTKGSIDSAGYDLYSYENKDIPAKGKKMIKTGISIAIPHNNYGRVAPRSGLTWKNFIDVAAGVIDEDFRGECIYHYINTIIVCVILFNFSNSNYHISKGDRIAQLLIEEITPTIIKEVNELTPTQRGEGKFGSTGK